MVSMWNFSTRNLRVSWWECAVEPADGNMNAIMLEPAVSNS